jgi:leader peptidase (prepilin peptidase)/N-methyltransferase
VSSFHIGIKNALLGGIIAFVIVFVIGMLRMGGLGGGDLKFAVALGMLLGTKYIVVALCLMFILGGLFSFLFYFNKIIGRKDYIPYGPFLFLGYVVSFLWFYS